MHDNLWVGKATFLLLQYLLHKISNSDGCLFWSYRSPVATSGGKVAKSARGGKERFTASSINQPGGKRTWLSMPRQCKVHCMLTVNLTETIWGRGQGAYNGHQRAESLFAVTMVNRTAVRTISAITVLAALSEGFSWSARVIRATAVGSACRGVPGEREVWTPHTLKLDPLEI